MRLPFLLLLFVPTLITAQLTQSDLETNSLTGKVKTVTIIDSWQEKKNGPLSYESQVLEFDENGHLVSEAVYTDSLGTKEVQKTFTIENGLRVKEVYESLKPAFTHIRYFTYDSLGRLIQKETYGSAGAVLNRETTTYNEAKNQKTELMHLLITEQRVGWKRISLFDDRGRLMEQTTFMIEDEIKFSNSITYAYDHSGNLVKSYHYYKKPGKLKMTYTYTYESDGTNWTVRYMHYKKQVYTTRRYIEYYE